MESKVTDKIIKQYEAIRESGVTNMFDFYEVQRIASNLGFYEFVVFTNNEITQYVKIFNAVERNKRK